MESSSFYASFVKLPTDPLCTKANYGNLENATIVSCPEKPSGHDEKRFICGDMRGNLTANIQTKLRACFLKLSYKHSFAICHKTKY